MLFCAEFFATFYQAIEYFTLTRGTVDLKKQANPQRIFFVLRISAPRKVKDRKIDSESRSLVTQKRLEQVDTISPGELLIEFCTLSLLKSQKYHRECYFHWKFLKTIQYLFLKEIPKFVSTI